MSNSDHRSIRGDRYLLGPDTFQFACHSGVACFTRCCHNADMYLYPYDIVRLKQRLGMTSEAFLTAHTVTALRDMPAFPNVMLKMSDRKGHPCTFLNQNGCTVYADRPYSCRAYPLEPAVYGDDQGNMRTTYYVMRHSYCLGHKAQHDWTAQSWMADQQMNAYDAINAQWAEIAARLQSYSAGPDAVENPAMKMAFMASYNMDTFRRFVFESTFTSRYRVPEERLAAVRQNDYELLRLGLDWIQRFLFGQGDLQETA